MANHLFRHLFGDLGVQLVAFLKFTFNAGQQCPHAGGNDAARWLDDDGQVAATFEDEPAKVIYSEAPQFSSIWLTQYAPVSEQKYR